MTFVEQKELEAEMQKYVKSSVVLCLLFGLVACANLHDTGEEKKAAPLDLTEAQDSEVASITSERDALRRELELARAAEAAPVNSEAAEVAQATTPEPTVAPVSSTTQVASTDRIKNLERELAAANERLDNRNRVLALSASAQRDLAERAISWPLQELTPNQLVQVIRNLKAEGYDVYLALRGQTITWPLAPSMLRGRKSPLNLLFISGRNAEAMLARIILCTLDGSQAGMGSEVGAESDTQGYTKPVPIYPRSFTVRRQGERVNVDHFVVNFAGKNWPVQAFELPDSLCRYVMSLCDQRTGKLSHSRQISFYGELARKAPNGDPLFTGSYTNFGYAAEMAGTDNAYWIGWSNHHMGVASQHRLNDNTHQLAFGARLLVNGEVIPQQKSSRSSKPQPKVQKKTQK
jgi:hypothetical protein